MHTYIFMHRLGGNLFHTKETYLNTGCLLKPNSELAKLEKIIFWRVSDHKWDICITHYAQDLGEKIEDGTEILLRALEVRKY